ncbi:MAG TPA: WD40 repeat domain-containing protein [Pyrinomonadaceae bacterium]|nr:WD40 repeat domain-containing protein [Pyrinomonadaceae bacterium]
MIAPLKNPFLGLQPFTREDRGKLYGRDSDLILIKDRIFSARTTLLFAGSGVGKTSFLNAKVIPDLKPQYAVVYHNQWAIDEPLISIGKAIASQVPTATIATPPSDQQTLLTKLCRLTKASEEEPGGASVNRCLLVLDQFEEIFQYHGYKPYFNKFIEELAEVVNSNDCNTRVLFSMREEFLGELSIFDNKTPDLFNNYYRLKCPNREEAAEIIELTCQFVEVQYRETNVKELVADLTKIRRGATFDVDAKSKQNEIVELDIVAPPYLQIACQRLWEKQYPTRKDPQTGVETLAVPRRDFLDSYKSGDAWLMLKEFCDEKLSSLKPKEQRLAADAFDYLVTKQGAKIAYELSSLASHMNTNEEELNAVLMKLRESGILRFSSASDRSRWFELYHDMYGSIIDSWKRDYRLNQQKLRRRNVVLGVTSLMIIMAGIALFTLAVAFLLVIPGRRKATLQEANLQDQNEFQENIEAYNYLLQIPWYRTTAGHLMADAWKRRAYNDEMRENKTDSFLSWLNAINVAPEDERGQLMAEAKNYFDSDDFASLQATIWFDGAVSATETNPPIFSADGNYILKTATNEFRLMKWDAQSGISVALSPPLQVEAQRSQTGSNAGQTGNAQESGTAQPEQPLIRAAAGNLAAGFDNYKFYIWTLDKGTTIWTKVRSGGQLSNSPPVGPPSRLSPSLRYSHVPKPNATSGSVGTQFSPPPKTTQQPPNRGSAPSNTYGYGSNPVSVSVTLSPNGKYFGLINDTGEAELYGINDKQTVTPVISPISSATKIVFGPDNRNFAVLLNDQRIQLRSISNADFYTIKLDSAVRDVSFSPDGKKIAVQFQGYLPAEIRQLPSGRLEGKTGNLLQSFSLNFLPDSTHLFSSRLTTSPLSSVLYIHYLDFQGPSDRKITFENFSGSYSNPNGQTILTTNQLGVARIWKITAAKTEQEKTLRSPNYLMSFPSENGRVIAYLLPSGEVEFWDTDTLTKISVAPLPSQTTTDEGSVIVSANGKLACIRGSNASAILWDIRAGQVLSTLTLSGVQVQSPKFSSDSDSFAFISPDGIHVWSHLSTSATEKVLGPIQNAFAPFLSPNGKYVVATMPANETGTPLKIFDVEAGAEIPLPDLPKRVANLQMNDQAKLVIVPGGDQANDPVLYDLKTRARQSLIHDAQVTTVAFSKQSDLMAIGCSDGALRLWRTDGSRIADLQKFGSSLRSVRFSDDGHKLIVLTDQWIHLVNVTDTGLSYRTGYFANAIFSRIEALNAEATMFRRINLDDDYRVVITDFKLEGNDTVTNVDFDPNVWMKKLGLRLDGRGQFVPARESILN